MYVPIFNLLQITKNMHLQTQIFPASLLCQVWNGNLVECTYLNTFMYAKNYFGFFYVYEASKSILSAFFLKV